MPRIRVANKIKKPHQGRRKPFGADTKHHYHGIVCPNCGVEIVSKYRVRHTYKSLWNWLKKMQGFRRFRKPKGTVRIVEEVDQPIRV
jgi:DNA-directed RNA polymerase subunit RPC12/RpoP